MWELVLVAVLAVLIGCWSFEMGLVVALCGVLGCCMTSGADRRPTSGRRSRAARVATNVEPKKKRRAIVREVAVRRTPLQPIVQCHPTALHESFLDEAVLAQKHKRSQAPDARAYHTTALPNLRKWAARELTTSDPAIVPLDGPETCVRSLGEV